MSAVTAHASRRGARRFARIVLCPQCGEDASYRCNLIDEVPYRLAASQARQLRDCGDAGAAVDVLTRLASVRIVNFIRPRWICACGAKFDD